MNERIRKLAEQARHEFLQMPTGYRPDQVGMHPHLMEKFAQLIVRECADIADINAHQQKSPGSYVRQHFGVGE